MNRSNIILTAALLMGFAVSAQAQEQTGRERALDLFRAGNYKEAISLLQNVTKQNKQDAEALYYLGAAYFRIDKINDGGKVFKKLVGLKPDNSQGYIGLAYFNLFKNNLAEAQENAVKALELNSKNAEGHYVLGEIGFRNGSYTSAYKSAETAIALDPKFAYPYLLKSASLTQSYAQTFGTVTRSPDERLGLLKEAVENLEKYISLEKSKDTMEQQRVRLESLKFFVEYYSRPKPAGTDPPYSKPIEILSKPKPAYTDAARYAKIRGTIRLLIEFSAEGKIRHIMVLKGLSHGLTEAAIGAATGIRFTPAERDGKAVSVARVVEYNFNFY